MVDPVVHGRFDIGVIDGLNHIAPTSRICIRTATFQPDTFLSAFHAGARGYLLKQGPDGDLVRDVLYCLGRYGAPAIDPAIVSAFEASGAPAVVMHTPEPATVRVTVSERAVLTLIAAGLSDTEIASRLSITVDTVHSHVLHARLKLGAATRSQLMVFAVRQGLLDH